MKKWLALLLLGNIYYAQEMTPECEGVIRQTDSLLSIVAYDKALENWEKSKKICANSSPQVYQQGTILLERELAMATDDVAKKAAAQRLITHYEAQQKHFPRLDRTLPIKRAQIMQKHELGSPIEIYALLDEMFQTKPEHFRDPQALYTYFSLYFDRYKKADKAVTLPKLLERRDALDMHFATLSDAAIYKRVSSSISALVDPEIDCAQLATYYKEVKPVKQKDTLWLDIAARRLYDKQCFASPMLLDLAQTAYGLKPSVSNAYTLGLLSYRAGAMDESAAYFETSASLEPDANIKAETLLTVASSVYMGKDYGKVVSFAKKALQAQPQFAKAHLLLAQTYVSAGKSCTDDDFEQRALYWLAVQEVQKAVALQPSLGASTKKLIENYQKKAPSAQEVKKLKKGGKAIAYGCWINQTVIVPKA